MPGTLSRHGRRSRAALDRRALARSWGVIAADQLLSPALPAYRDRRLFSMRPSLGRARALMHGEAGTASMPVPAGCDRCREAAQVVRAGLAAIGIRVELRRVPDTGAAVSSGEGFDLVDLEARILYPDSASFLGALAGDLPAGWMAAGPRAAVRAASALAAYGIPGSAQLVGPRIGCRRFSSFGYGLDLAAICLEGPDSM